MRWSRKGMVFLLLVVLLLGVGVVWLLWGRSGVEGVEEVEVVRERSSQEMLSEYMTLLGWGAACGVEGVVEKTEAVKSWVDRTFQQETQEAILSIFDFAVEQTLLAQESGKTQVSCDEVLARMEGVSWPLLGR